LDDLGSLSASVQGNLMATARQKIHESIKPDRSRSKRK